jgi:hypothetical protein
LSPYWYIITIPFLGLFFARNDLRRKMSIFGLLSVLILVIESLFSPEHFSTIASREILSSLFLKILVAFCLGAIVSVVYETFVHRIVTPERHPDRKKMIYLLSGTVVFFSLVFLLNLNIAYSLLTGLLINLIVILFVNPELIWDKFFSGFGTAIFYLFLYFMLFREKQSDAANFWFWDRLSSFSILSLPLEKIIIIMLFGFLWGPIYVAIKDYNEK